MNGFQIEINPEFVSYKDAIIQIVKNFDSEGKVLFEGRNILKEFDLAGHKIVVKRFKKLDLLKKILYKFRKYKALKAYINAFRLIDSGVSTPAPIAFVNEVDSYGFIDRAYYICEYCPYPELGTFYGKADDFNHDVIEAFAGFVATLHNEGIVFDDLNKSNVLVDLNPDKINFYLIDINRMRFIDPKSFSVTGRFENFSHFCYNVPELFRFFVTTYVDICIRTGELPPSSDRSKLIDRAIKIKAFDDRRRHRLHLLKHPFRKE